MFNLINSNTNNKKTIKKVVLKPKKVSIMNHKKEKSKNKNNEKSNRRSKDKIKEKRIVRSDKKLYQKSMIVQTNKRPISSSMKVSEEKKLRKHNTILMNKLNNFKNDIIIENKGKKNIKIKTVHSYKNR